MNIRYLLPLAISLGPIILSSCGQSQSTPQQNQLNAPVMVSAYQVTQEQVTGVDTYPATVVPINEVELRPQVGGYITDIYVSDGKQVKKGQKLYEIDRSKYQAAYRQAQANVASAKANLERVRQDVERYERLLKQDAIARQQVEYARADFLTAESQVAAAEAQLASTATDLRYSVIVAPFDGRIGISQVRVGAQVSPGQPLLNTISSTNPMAVEFVVNQQEIPRFSRFLQNTQAQPDSLFTLQLGGQMVYPLPGKILALDRAVDRQTGTITVRLSYPNPSGELVPGMSVVVRSLNEDIGRQVIIPERAVAEQMGEYYTYVVRGDSVEQRKVMLGTRVKDKVVVREGLQAGENIVVEGTQRLRPGVKIQLASSQPNASSAAASGGR
jgi:membrane fusion protein (multidrug efflux system)